MKRAIRKRLLPKKPIDLLIDEALKKSLISKKEHALLSEAEAIRLDAIQVDAFTQKQYLGK